MRPELSSLDAMIEKPSSTLVVVDFRGTVASIRPDAGLIVPSVATHEALLRAADQFGWLAALTGRPAADARARLRVDGMIVAGYYGGELWVPRTQTLTRDERFFEEAERVRLLVEAWRKDLERAGIEIVEQWATRKLRCSTIGDRQDWLLRAVAADAGNAGLAVRRSEGMLDVRPPLNKAEGVRRILGVAGPGVRHVVYFGDDDLNDLRAFEVLRDEHRLAAVACVAVEQRDSPQRDLLAAADLRVRGVPGATGLIAYLAAAAAALTSPDLPPATAQD
jgi:trehalose 6-phosphate phosphatase